MIRLITFTVLISIYALLTNGKPSIWYVDVGVAVLFLLISNLVGFLTYKTPPSEIEPCLCSHGVPWDECPDCSH